MKKVIGIYIIGVALGWFMGFNHVRHINKKYDLKTTYGDMAFVSVMSLFSWLDVAPLCIIELSESDFWDKPIN
jgi:hypothetical protein